jgi:hypothetical protein
MLVFPLISHFPPFNYYYYFPETAQDPETSDAEKDWVAGYGAFVVLFVVSAGAIWGIRSWQGRKPAKKTRLERMLDEGS